jgi:hypothetical protein
LASTPTPPSAAASYINQAASGTGIPKAVVQAQAYNESSYNDKAVSSAGAEGFWQFLPSTYNALAANSGVPENSEFNVADETKVYVTYMNQLLQQEGGSIFKALEAYNAGPADLNAGSGYASEIMSQAGVSQSAKAGATASTTGIWQDITNPLGSAENAVESGIAGQFEDLFNSTVGAVFSSLGIPSLKDLLQRLGLILLGVVLLIVGISLLGKGGGNPINVTTSSNESTDESGNTSSTVSKTIKHPFGKSTSTASKASNGLGTNSAIKAAADA